MQRGWFAAVAGMMLVVPLGFGHDAAHAVTALPTVSVGDVSFTEGDAGSVGVKVPVDLDVAGTTAIRVPYTVALSADGSADAGDAKLMSGSLSFPIGTTSKFVTVTAYGDTVVEPDQHVDVRLGSPIGATIADGVGVVTIKDDDANGVNAGTEASVGDVTVNEANAGTHTASLPVTLSRPAAVRTVVSYDLGCSSASTTSDVKVARFGSVVIAAGQRSGSINVGVLPDTKPEPTKAVDETIRTATAGVSVVNNTGSATITDTDAGTSTPDPSPCFADGLPQTGGQAVPNFVSETAVAPTGFIGGAVGDVESYEVSFDGTPVNTPVVAGWGAHNSAAISADGRYVAFQSFATNLVPNDTNFVADVFIRDRMLGTTERIVKNDGTQVTNVDFGAPAGEPGQVTLGALLNISADGRYVTFSSGGVLVPMLNPTGPTAYLYDRVAHNLEVVSAMPDGTPFGMVFANAPVSAHGRYVAFKVWGGLYPGTSAQNGTWLRDRVANTTTMIVSGGGDGSGSGLSISANGRYVATTYVVGGQCPGSCRLDVVDLVDGSVQQVDVNSSGQPGVESCVCYLPDVSSDGRFIMFKAAAWNLIPGLIAPPLFAGAWDTTLTRSFVRDRLNHTTTMIQPYAPTTPAYAEASTSGHGISDDGLLAATDVTSQSGPQGQAWDLSSPTPTPLAIGSVAAKNQMASASAVSRDGRYVLAGVGTVVRMR